MNTSLGRALIGILFLAGALSWAVLFPRLWQVSSEPFWLGGALILWAVTPIRRSGLELGRQINSTSAASTWLWPIAVFIVAGAYLLTTALLQQRDLFPKYHDQQEYLTQAHLVAGGHLWLPQHPVADFFETFYILVKPVYAPIYFPGTALVYAPAIWLHLPYWLGPLLVAAAGVTLAFAIVRHLVDTTAGLLAALMLVSLRWFRHLSIIMMSHSVELMLALAMVLSWLNWRRSGRKPWAALAGMFAGWAAITRPIDTLTFAVPLVLTTLINLRKHSWRDGAISIAIMVIPAIPFLTLQLVFNHGVTGRWLESPLQYYSAIYAPGIPAYGFETSHAPTTRPATHLVQQQLFYQYFAIPNSVGHTLANFWADAKTKLQVMFESALPGPLLIPLLCIGILGVRTLPRAAVWTQAPVFFVAYALYTIFIPHYAAVVAPAFALSVVLGRESICAAWPRWRGAIGLLIALLIVVQCFLVFPEFDSDMRDDAGITPSVKVAAQGIPDQIKGRAVVLFRFDVRTSNVHDEPVYNTDAAWPDDARIVHAHDLGAAKDQEIFDYYARLQPEREFYLFDRGTGGLLYLGMAPALAKNGWPKNVPSAPDYQ